MLSMVKKIFLYFLFLASISFAMPAKSFAAFDTKPLSDSAANARMLSNIVTRVTEIQNMDKSTLSTRQKKELKKELREMKKMAEGLDKNIYLYAGAIALVIILLLFVL